MAHEIDRQIDRSRFDLLDEGEHVIGLVTQADLERAMALLTAAGRSVRR